MLHLATTIYLFTWRNIFQGVKFDDDYDIKIQVKMWFIKQIVNSMTVAYRSLSRDLTNSWKMRKIKSKCKIYKFKLFVINILPIKCFLNGQAKLYFSLLKILHILNLHILNYMKDSLRWLIFLLQISVINNKKNSNVM